MLGINFSVETHLLLARSIYYTSYDNMPLRHMKHTCYDSYPLEADPLQAVAPVSGIVILHCSLPAGDAVAGGIPVAYLYFVLQSRTDR